MTIKISAIVGSSACLIFAAVVMNLIIPFIEKALNAIQGLQLLLGFGVTAIILCTVTDLIRAWFLNKFNKIYD